MKKLIAFLCALTLMLSLSVAAFAEDISGSGGNTATGTQTLTVNSPDLTWIMEIPADQVIAFGATETYIGDFKIKNVSWDDLPSYIYGWVNYNGQLTGPHNALNYVMQCEIYNKDDVLIQTSTGQTRYGVSSGENWGDETSAHPAVPVYYSLGSFANHYAKFYVLISNEVWGTALP